MVSLLDGSNSQELAAIQCEHFPGTHWLVPSRKNSKVSFVLFKLKISLKVFIKFCLRFDFFINFFLIY